MLSELIQRNKMRKDISLVNILIISIVFGILIIYITYRLFHLKLIAAFTLGLLFSYGLLNMIYPLSYLMYQKDTVIIGVYIIIEILVPIYIFLYLFYLLITNHRRKD